MERIKASPVKVHLSNTGALTALGSYKETVKKESETFAVN